MIASADVRQVHLWQSLQFRKFAKCPKRYIVMSADVMLCFVKFISQRRLWLASGNGSLFWCLTTCELSGPAFVVMSHVTCVVSQSCDTAVSVTSVVCQYCRSLYTLVGWCRKSKVEVFQFCDRAFMLPQHLTISGKIHLSLWLLCNMIYVQNYKNIKKLKECVLFNCSDCYRWWLLLCFFYQVCRHSFT